MEDAQRTTSLSALLGDARRRLVETGTRNRLIHVNRSSKRSNALDIDGERTVDIFDLVRTQGTRQSRQIYFRRSRYELPRRV